MKRAFRNVAAGLATGIVALLASGVASAAKVVLTPVEVQAITSVSNSFEGTLDGVMAGEIVRFKINSPTNFSYSYVNAGENFTFDGELARAGGNVKGNPTLNFTQPDRDDVRFEWVGNNTIQFEYWEPGKKAGQTRNNPAMAKAMLTIAAAPTEAAEVVTAERQEAREAATTLLPAGSYDWQPFRTTLTMGDDGSFHESAQGYDARGFFIKNGDELCFDVVDGNCYTVNGPGGNGAYTLTYVAKKMQSSSQNSSAGQQTTLTPKP